MRKFSNATTLATLLSLPFVLAFAACAAEPPASAAAPAPAAPAAAAAPACDAALGRRVFGQCAICHSLEKDAPPVAGPNLYGVLERAAGTAPGFAYSRALRESGKRWTREELDRFLTQPSAAVPGTTMAFAGLKKPEERAAVICHLAAGGG